MWNAYSSSFDLISTEYATGSWLNSSFIISYIRRKKNILEGLWIQIYEIYPISWINIINCLICMMEINLLYCYKTLKNEVKTKQTPNTGQSLACSIWAHSSVPVVWLQCIVDATLSKYVTMVLNLSGPLPPLPSPLFLQLCLFLLSILLIWLLIQKKKRFCLSSFLFFSSLDFFFDSTKEIINFGFVSIKREIVSLFFLNLYNKGTTAFFSLRGNQSSEHYGAATPGYGQHRGILHLGIWSINLTYTSIWFSTDTAIFFIYCEYRQWDAALV